MSWQMPEYFLRNLVFVEPNVIMLGGRKVFYFGDAGILSSKPVA